MNKNRFLTVGLLAGGLLGLFAGSGSAQDKVFVPRDIKALFEEGLASRRVLSGIPVETTRHLFFPYYASPGLMHNVFGLRIKNASLPFAPDPASISVEKADMKASFDVFLQFREIDGGKPGKIAGEIYVPAEIVIPAGAYQAEAAEVYFLGSDLAPGTYLMALAVRTKDKTATGTAYFEFTTPNPAKLGPDLGLSPIVLIEKIEQMPAQEDRTTLRRGEFTYLVLKIRPNLAEAIAPQKSLEFLYFVIGAKPDAQRKFKLETAMEVRQGDEVKIVFDPTVMESPFVSLPLPLRQTIITRLGDKETRDTVDLKAGRYTLVVKIKDAVSGATVTKNADFEIK